MNVKKLLLNIFFSILVKMYLGMNKKNPMFREFE